MRNESCRRCGHILEISRKCEICNEPNQYHCHKCGFESEKQIHSTCLVIGLTVKC